MGLATYFPSSLGTSYSISSRVRRFLMKCATLKQSHPSLSPRPQAQSP